MIVASMSIPRLPRSRRVPSLDECQATSHHASHRSRMTDEQKPQLTKNGVVLGKLQSLDETLTEIQSLGRISADQLRKDWKTRRAVERDLQVLVEVVIDVCHRILALHEQAPAPTSADAITRCIALGVLADRPEYRRMVQFRNVIVHRYEQVHVDILVDIVNNRLGDFRTFRDEVLRHQEDEHTD